MTPPDTDLYVWQEKGPDGRWGVIAAVIPFLPYKSATLLCARMRQGIEVLRPIAELHAKETGHPVRMARYHYAETVSTIGEPHAANDPKTA